MPRTRPLPERRRRARRAAVASLSAAVLLTSCGGATGDDVDEAPNPAPLEVGSDPTPDSPPNVGNADPEGVPAVPGQTEGVGPDPT